LANVYHRTKDIMFSDKSQHSIKILSNNSNVEPFGSYISDIDKNILAG